MNELKKQLYKSCLDSINRRINTAREAMLEAQEAANEDDKSSAGDKHETSLAMIQLEVENMAKNLKEVENIKAVLLGINPDKPNTIVGPGAAVETSNGKFYIAIAAGKIDHDYFAISMSSPIGQVLKGLKEGEKAEFNGKEFKILSIT